MKAATDNADELVDTLTRNFNQARQAEITTEIMEVVGGAEALRTAEKAEKEAGGGRGTQVVRAAPSGEDIGRV